jgi:hypothetical protein
MASSTTAEPRTNLGRPICLHRSETHTKCETDAKNLKERAEERKYQGFASKQTLPFKALGKPDVDNKTIMEQNQSKIVQVDARKMQFQQRRQREKREQRPAEWQSSDNKDSDIALLGEKGKKDAEEDAKNKALHLYGLFDKDLPRCNGRDKTSDGFYTLREFIRESETRVQQVKSLVPDMVYGLDYSVSMLDYLMPNREEYPPVTEKRRLPSRGKGGNTDLDGPAASSSQKQPQTARAVLQAARGEGDKLEPKPPAGSPHSARPPRPGDRSAEKRAKFCPGRPEVAQAYRRQVYVSPISSEMKPRNLPIQLPSLKDLIEQSSLGYHHGSEGDQGGQRRGRNDYKKSLQKEIDKAERNFWRNIKEQGFELKHNISILTHDDKKGGVDSGVPSSNDQPGPSGAQESQSERDPSAEAYLKVIALMRETDPTISPVARLRETLQIYQKAREEHKDQLQNTLYSMDADRLHSLKRRAHNLNPKSHGPTADAKTSCQLMRLEAEKEMLERHIRDQQRKQFFWYRDLWRTIYQDKRELPDVAKFIFDFVKKVLEYGEDFTKEMYFSMLSKIENFEYNGVISKLVVKMLDGIEGAKLADLVEWFKKNRGEVPPKVRDFTERADHPVKSGTDDADRDREKTFMTNEP